MLILPGDDVVVSGQASGHVVFFSIQSATTVLDSAAHTGNVDGLALHPSGLQFASGSQHSRLLSQPILAAQALTTAR